MLQLEMCSNKDHRQPAVDILSTTREFVYIFIRLTNESKSWLKSKSNIYFCAKFHLNQFSSFCMKNAPTKKITHKLHAKTHLPKKLLIILLFFQGEKESIMANIKVKCSTVINNTNLSQPLSSVDRLKPIFLSLSTTTLFQINK